MKKLLLLLLLPLSIWANNDKYRLVLTDDPATTITIAWNQISGTSPVVKYGTEDFGKNADSYPSTKTVDRQVNFKGMDNRFAKLTGLKPNTAYYFVIKDSKGVSKRFWFKTAPSDRSKLSFIAGGDSRNHRDVRQNANKLVAKLKPNAVLFGGDMTNLGWNYQWKGWFDDWQLTTASDGRMFPIVPTRGNHEKGDVIYKLFDTKHEDSYGAITFGDNFVRAYTLNTEISLLGNQRDWLEADLKKQSTQDALYRIVQYHKPMRPHTAGKTEGQDVYEAWAGLFYEFGVKMVIDCDSHIAKVTYPIKPSNGIASDQGFERDLERGTTYVGEGSWGAPLRPNNDRKSWTRDAKKMNQFKWFFVSEDKIESRTIQVDNANKVGNEVTNENPFIIPSKLVVWKMKDGTSIVEIKPTKVVKAPKIQFAATMKTQFEKKDNISVAVNVIDQGNGIEEVVFLAEDKLGNMKILAKKTSAPYKLENKVLPENGVYKIMVVAKTKDAEHTIEKEILVGEFSGEISVSLSTNKDNVEEKESNGYMQFNSSDLELGYDGLLSQLFKPQGYQKVGLRYNNLNIPKGAKITSAKIQFWSKDKSSNPAETTIYLEKNVNASKFIDKNKNLSSRTYFSKSVVWNIKPWTSGGHGSECLSPSLASLLNELVSDNNWKAGDNSIVFKFIPTGPSSKKWENKRNPYSKKGGHSPKLTITYDFKADNSAGIIDVVKEETNKLICYPNPTNDKVRVLNTKNFTFKGVYDITGRKVNVIYNEEANNLSLRNLSSGIYFVQFVNKGTRKFLTSKIIKK